MLFAAVAGVVFAFAPGLISYDTRVSLIDAETGAPVDWYTPFGSMIWSLFIESGLGLGTAFALQTALVVVALYGLLRMELRRVPGALATGLICAFPPMYAQLSNLSRDTLFLGFSLSAFWLYARGREAEGPPRGFLLGGAAAAAVVAFLYRQNGVAILFAVLSAVGIELVRGARPRPRRLQRLWPLAPALLGAAAVTAAIGTAVQAVYSATPVIRTHPERHLFVYDLAAITTATNENAFPPELQGRPHGVTPQDMSYASIDRRFDPATVLALYEPYGMWDTDFTNEPLAREEAATLRSGWLDAIVEHPLDYVYARARMTASQLGLVDRPTDAFYGVVAADNFEHPIEFTRPYDWAEAYVGTFVGTASDVPLDLPWLYFLIATAGAIYIRRRRAELGAAATLMTLAVWANLAGLGLASIASSFRYTSIAVPVALIIAVWSLAPDRNAAPRTRARV